MWLIKTVDRIRIWNKTKKKIKINIGFTTKIRSKEKLTDVIPLGKRLILIWFCLIQINLIKYSEFAWKVYDLNMKMLLLVNKSWEMYAQNFSHLDAASVFVKMERNVYLAVIRLLKLNYWTLCTRTLPHHLPLWNFWLLDINVAAPAWVTMNVWTAKNCNQWK